VTGRRRLSALGWLMIAALVAIFALAALAGLGASLAN
jgi:hypothetical protein